MIQRVTVQNEITDEYVVISTADGITGHDDGGEAYHIEPRHEVIEDGVIRLVARAGDRLWVNEFGDRYWTA